MNSLHFRWNALPVDSVLMMSAAMMFFAAARPAPIAAKNASVTVAMFASSTMAATSNMPKMMPDVSADGCDGNSGNNSLATITASHRGTVWNLGAFSSVVRVSRTRSMTSPSEERPDPSASSNSSPPNEAGISRHHPGSDHSLDAAEHGVEQRAEGIDAEVGSYPGTPVVDSRRLLAARHVIWRF